MRELLFLLMAITAPLAVAADGFTEPGGFGEKSYGIIYPNYELTPGSTVPGITKEDVCAKGYAKRMRDNVSSAEKAATYSRYGLKKDRTLYQIDHLIPLGLGGSNNQNNLWPIPKTKNQGFREKQIAAQYLHDEVCNDKIDLDQAQKLMVRDWHSVYLDWQWNRKAKQDVKEIKHLQLQGTKK